MSVVSHPFGVENTGCSIDRQLYDASEYRQCLDIDDCDNIDSS